MKKEVIKYYQAPNLTEMCKIVAAKEHSMKYNRAAMSGSGDLIFGFYSPSTRFRLEFTVKVNAKGEKYVNWARVEGRENHVDMFLQKCGHIGFQKAEFIAPGI